MAAGCFLPIEIVSSFLFSLGASLNFKNNLELWSQKGQRRRRAFGSR
jgi:hypothetical protein